MKSAISLLLLLFFLVNCFAQAGKDSLLVKKDTSRSASIQRTVIQKPRGPSLGAVQNNARDIKADTAAKAVKNIVTGNRLTVQTELLRQHPYYNFFGSPRNEVKIRRSDAGKNGLFYLLVALLIFFSLIRLIFFKYISNLFIVFFRVSLKQKQIREQLQQSTLPSLLLNTFFILSGGIYVSFLLEQYQFISESNFWYLILYSVIALGIIYIGKFLVLKMVGWVFNISEATDTYIFVIFLVNKILGVFLLPFIILIAFSNDSMQSMLITLSFVMISILFAYRYIISYEPVRKEIKVHQFHFFLYICAFELTPLLLIYKVLLLSLKST